GGRLSDIDISKGGDLIVGTLDNAVVLSDMSLNDASSFLADRSGNITATFVAFTLDVPEPSTFVFLAAGCLAFGFAFRYRCGDQDQRRIATSPMAASLGLSS